MGSGLPPHPRVPRLSVRSWCVICKPRARFPVRAGVSRHSGGHTVTFVNPSHAVRGGLQTDGPATRLPLPALTGPGRVLRRDVPQGRLGTAQQLPSSDLAFFVNTDIPRLAEDAVSMEMNTKAAQPGPGRGGQKDPGGPPNWFICQVIGGKNGAVIGHGLLCRGRPARPPGDAWGRGWPSLRSGCDCFSGRKSYLISPLVPGLQQRELLG